MSSSLDRRSFLKAGAAAAGGLLLGFWLGPDPAGGFGQGSGTAEAAGMPVTSGASGASGADFVPNAYLRIGRDGEVVVLVPKTEMGQGVLTSLPAIVAEELDVAWSRVRSEHSPLGKDYRWNWGQQFTGGSDAVQQAWTHLRKAAATARAMLVDAAARTWGVPARECSTADGEVLHGPTGRRLAYGDLADAAARLSPPGNVALKDPAAYKLVGKSLPRLDTPSKVDGTARFSLDARLPGMLIACVVRCPVPGGKAKSFDAAKAKAVPGVRHVLPVSTGVAVVADSYWQARKGAGELAVAWDEGKYAKISSQGIEEAFRAAASRPEKTLEQHGDVRAALSGASRRLEADYWVPYLAHATMEPPNCTADVRPDGCDLWVGTQAQTQAQQVVSKITGLPEHKVAVHTLLLGGGFGRKAESDFVTEAVELSKAIGKPVKVVWSREDDIAHDFYRSATYHRLEGGVSPDGWPVAWHHRFAGTSVLDRIFPVAKVLLGKDPIVTDGAEDLPYRFDNAKIEVGYHDPGVPVGFWRSVGFSANTYAVECFLDELAALGGKDPLEVRRRLLGHNPRMLAAVDLAAARAGWGKPLPAGRFRGLSACAPFGSHVALVVDVSVEESTVRVQRAVCAVDCGLVINPGIVTAQMEGSIAFGLAAALAGEITLANGRVEQSNFHDYPALKMSEMPEVEVHLVPSREAPGGVGEIGVPCVAPAVANAVRAATGKPVRRMPIRLET